MLKQVIDLAAPYIAKLFNRSLVAGHFPHSTLRGHSTPSSIRLLQQFRRNRGWALPTPAHTDQYQT